MSTGKKVLMGVFQLISLVAMVGVVWLFLSRMNGPAFPLVSTDLQALIALGILGGATCFFGFFFQTKLLGWGHITSLLSILLTLAAIGTFLLGLLGIDVWIVNDYRSAFFVLSIIVLLKFGLSWFKFFSKSAELSETNEEEAEAEGESE